MVATAVVPRVFRGIKIKMIKVAASLRARARKLVPCEPSSVTWWVVVSSLGVVMKLTEK